MWSRLCTFHSYIQFQPHEENLLLGSTLHSWWKLSVWYDMFRLDEKCWHFICLAKRDEAWVHLVQTYGYSQGVISTSHWKQSVEKKKLSVTRTKGLWWSTASSSKCKRRTYSDIPYHILVNPSLAQLINYANMYIQTIHNHHKIQQYWYTHLVTTRS